MRKSYGDYCFVKELRKTPTGIVNLVSNSHKDYYILQTMVFKGTHRKASIEQKSKLLKRLNHPNVQRIVDIFTESTELTEVLALITEYCEDGTLEEKIGTFNRIETRSAILDLCAAYRYLHEELNLLHGYLTPQTVLIRNSKLVVGEFSHAEYLGKGDGKTNSLKGKKLYMSPQMINFQKYGLQNDIWALGIIFIQLLFRKPISSIMKIIPGNHPEFPNIIINKLNNGKIRGILQDMLRKDPKRIPIKEAQERFVSTFVEDPLELKMHNQYIEVRNFSSHSCLVKDSQSGEVLTLKRYTLPKELRKNLQTRIQILEQLKHRNIIRILDVKIFKQCEIQVITEYCDKKSVLQNIEMMETIEMVEAVKDIWEGFSYLYSENVLVLDNINIEKILIKEGKIKMPVITEYTFMPKKQRYTEADCIWKLGLAFLQIVTRKSLKQGDKTLIRNKTFQIEADDKILEKIIKEMLYNQKDMSLERLDSLLKEEIYSRNLQTEDSYIGNYRLVKEISRGAFGNVFVAQTKDNPKQLLALKKIKTMKEAITQQQLTEATISMQLKHTNIVSTHLYFIHKKTQLIIIMEMCEEYTLQEIIGKIQSTQEGLKIIRDVAEGVRYLHCDMNIVHRDLKPANILCKNGRYKLADMGRAKYVVPGETMQAAVGSTFYMAPEMIDHEPYNISVDIWNLGIIFLEVLLNEKFKTAGMIAKKVGFPEVQICKFKDEGLRGHMARMIHKDPKERYGIGEVLGFVGELECKAVEGRLSIL